VITTGSNTDTESTCDSMQTTPFTLGVLSGN